MLPTLRTLLPRRLPRSILLPALQSRVAPPSRPLSTGGKDPDDPWSSWNGGASSNPASSGLDWDSSTSSWSTGLTKDHFDGDAVGHQIPSTPAADEDPRASLQVRNLSSAPGQANNFYAKIAKSMGDSRSDNSLETADEFERRLFGSIDDVSSTDSFYRKLDKLEKARGRSNMGSKMGNGGNSQFNEDGMDGGYNTLADGMDAKLKKAASTFVYDDEIGDDYQYRPDVTFKAGMTYTPRDLDLTKPGIQRAPPQRPEFETTTADVLKKADFRNVKFLAHFITEAGIIIKRSQTKISAKAQRKVAREIKTARAFGLMPFTTMGRKRFVFGRTAKVDDEQEFETYSSNNMPEAVEASEES